MDPVTAKALLRYQVISAYLAADPPRGKRRKLLRQLADRTWVTDSGEAVTVKAETIRYWLRKYRRGGFEALKDKPRIQRGRCAIDEDLIQIACRLKREVPERSIERIIVIMEELQMAPPGLIRRSTLHRALKARGLSARSLKIPDKMDLDRFAADFANDLWQSDMLQGPWLPDPTRPGKKRKSYLYAFLDDASRLLLYGRFFFKGDLPAMELVFKRALQRYGRPVRVYYDNGKVYRAGHMRLICAELGIHRPVFTTPYRPMGHGKIEAFNRFCVSNFIAEVKASTIKTLDQLNEAFLAWIDEHYNRRHHSELGTSPKNRWMKDAARVHYLDEEKIRAAFLWREIRTADKTALVRLFNRRYKVLPQLARKKLEIRYDPERLGQIEIYVDGRFRQRAKIFNVSAHRAPVQPVFDPTPLPDKPTDYLGHLTRRHRKDLRLEAFLSILKKRLAQVFDRDMAVDFYQAFGPFDLKKLTSCLDDLLESQPDNLHLSFYLQHIRDQLIGD